MDSTHAWQQFGEAAARISGTFPDALVLARFQKLYDLLVEANKTTNLTRITSLESFLSLHLLDSMTLLPHLSPYGPAFSLIDIGSGAGFPALPLALLFPEARIVAVDSVGKKTAFIRAATEALELGDLTAEHGRSEDLAHQPALRHAFDVAVARAVAPLNVLSELCLPFVRIGGRFIAMKTAQALEAEISAAQNALETCGAKVQEIITLSEPLLPGRALVLIAKNSPTPKNYPRKAGDPSRKPL